MKRRYSILGLLMKKDVIITAMLLLWAGVVFAQKTVEKSGVNTVCYGDLNKDGVKDKVVVTTPQGPAGTKKMDTGFVQNFNQPVMSIYFGQGPATGSGQVNYKLFRTYKNVLPRVEDDYECLEYYISITPQGTLRLAFNQMYTMGSWTARGYDNVFRYQKGDFYMIGSDDTIMIRNTGKQTITSCNYVTHKKQIITARLTDNDDAPKKTGEKWESIPAAPLQKLGAKNLKRME